MFELLTGLGLALPAGLNAYIPLLALALADRYTGLIHLAAPYDIISSPAAILVISMLLVVELLADKVPLIDHANDLVQAVVRPTIGALMVMASTDAVPVINPILAMLLGLTVAGSVHAAKSTFRPLVTATTAGIGNPVVSATEDGVALVLVAIALIAPILVAFIVLIAASLAVLLLVYRRRARTART